MAHTVLDDWKILPRLMMLAVTVLTYQAVHWFMSLPDPSVAQSGLVSVCMGALTGCFGIWMGKESKTSVTQTQTSSRLSMMWTSEELVTHVIVKLLELILGVEMTLYQGVMVLC